MIPEGNLELQEWRNNRTGKWVNIIDHFSPRKFLKTYKTAETKKYNMSW